MGREAGRNQWVVNVRVVNKVGRLAHVFGRIACPRCRELYDRCSNHCPDLQVYGGLSDDFRKEVLIAEACCTPGDHLRYGQFSAVTDHFCADPAFFNGPDTFFQPDFQRHIVGQAPHQSHGAVCVCIDEARDQDVMGLFYRHAWLVFFVGVGEWQNVSYAPIVHNHGMPGQDHVCRFNWDAPPGCNQGIAMLHSRGSIRVMLVSASGVLNTAEGG